MATAGTGIDEAGIPAPMATAGVGMGMCNGSSGCGVEPSFTGRLGADSCGSSLSSSDVSFRYEPGARSYTMTSNYILQACTKCISIDSVNSNCIMACCSCMGVACYSNEMETKKETGRLTFRVTTLQALEIPGHFPICLLAFLSVLRLPTSRTLTA